MLTLRGHKTPIQSIQFSPDGTSLLSVDGGNNMRVWELPTGKLRWETNKSLLSSFAFTPDGKNILTCSRAPYGEYEGRRAEFDAQYPVQLRDVLTGDTSSGPFQHPKGEALYQLRFSPDGTRCVARTRSTRDLMWWEYPTGKQLPNWKKVVGNEFWYLVAMSFSPNGLCLAGIGPEGLRVFDVHNGSVQIHHKCKLIQGDGRLAYHTDGRQLAYSTGARATIFDLDTRTELIEIKQARKHFLALAFTTDGRHLATVSNEETVKFWDPSTGQLATEFAWEVGGLRCLAFAPDGTTAATGGTGKKIVVWDLDA